MGKYILEVVNIGNGLNGLFHCWRKTDGFFNHTLIVYTCSTAPYINHKKTFVNEDFTIAW